MPEDANMLEVRIMLRKVICFINPASTSATLFSSLRFDFSYTFSSLPLPLPQHSSHQSSFHFSNIIFITSVSICGYTFSSLPIPLQQSSFHQSGFHCIKILFTNPASISATLSCIQIYLHGDFIV